MIRKKLETSESEDPAGDSEEYEEDEDEEDEDEEDEDEEQTSEEETEEDCNAESCTSATPDSTCEDEEEEEENMEFNYASRPNRTMNGSKSRTTLNKPLGGSSTISWAGSLPKSKSWQSSVRPSQTSVYASQQPSERASQGAKQKEMRRSNASSLKNTQDDGRGTLRLSQVASLASKARSTSSSFFGRCIRFDDEEDDDDDDDDEEEEEEEEPKNGRQRASTPSPNKGRYSSQEPQAFKKVQIPDSTEVLKVEWTVKMPKNLYVGAGAGGSNNVGWSPELRSCLSTSSLIAGNVIGAVADGAPYGYNPSMMAGGYYQGQQQGGYGGYPGGGYGPQQSFYGVPGGGGGGGGYFTAYGPPMSPEPPPYYYHQSHSIPTTMRWTATGSCPVAQCPLCGYTYQAPR